GEASLYDQLNSLYCTLHSPCRNVRRHSRKSGSRISPDDSLGGRDNRIRGSLRQTGDIGRQERRRGPASRKRTWPLCGWNKAVCSLDSIFVPTTSYILGDRKKNPLHFEPLQTVDSHGPSRDSFVSSQQNQAAPLKLYK
ncbi:hypothetical protein L249_3811, partial [Ophiocordyceps polyrhachis-furcata BCC 54312]